MARLREQARVIRWRGKHVLVFWDYLLDKPRRKSCRALKAFTKTERDELVKEYRSREENDRVEVRVKGGRLDYDALLVTALDKFLKHLEQEEKTRKANPANRTVGLSAGAAKELNITVKSFRSWLCSTGKERLTTGDLDHAALRSYLNFLASTQSRNGNKSVMRSAATLNKYRAGLRTCLKYLDRLRPKMFPDFLPLKEALKKVRSESKQPTAFSPDELSTFLSVALDREKLNRTTLIHRRKSGGKNESFKKRTPAVSVTPVSRLFLLLALTGCRLGEALALKWAEVDLERGRITFRNVQKTGRTRIVPISNAPEGEVAPQFLELLKKWRKEDPKREYVLPHSDFPKPILPKHGWAATRKKSKMGRLGPQLLRQNFTSYAASLGIPSSVCALWQGHSPEVADKHYRGQVLDRKKAKSFEAAMGLAQLLS